MISFWARLSLFHSPRALYLFLQVFILTLNLFLWRSLEIKGNRTVWFSLLFDIFLAVGFLFNSQNFCLDLRKLVWGEARIPFFDFKEWLYLFFVSTSRSSCCLLDDFAVRIETRVSSCETSHIANGLLHLAFVDLGKAPEFIIMTIVKSSSCQIFDLPRYLFFK